MNKNDKNNYSECALLELQQLLKKILNSKGQKRSSLVISFEDKLNESWEKDKDIFKDAISEVLSDLLNNLAYYQPNPIIRLSDKDLFDDIKLDNLIKDTLGRIEKLINRTRSAGDTLTS